MFKSLNVLRDRVETLNIVLSFKPEGMINVVVIPKVKQDLLDKEPQLATPFSLTGTAEELEAHFASSFGQFDSVKQNLQQQVEQQIAELKKAAETKTVKPALTSSSKSKAKADEEDEESFDLSAEDLF